MEFTNANFTSAEEVSDLCNTSAEATQYSRSIAAGDAVKSMPKLRKVTNSPAREYAFRPGIVTEIPDNVAALILSFKGRAEVQRNGIKVERKEISDKPRFYWHEDSRICNDLYGEHVLYVINPNSPDVIHIMDIKGRYIETVPLKGEPDILDYAAAGKEIAKHKRAMTRHQTRLQELHGEDTQDILERHRKNAEEITRATTIMPADAVAQPTANRSPSTAHSDAVAPTTADRMITTGQAIQNRITGRRENRASAAALGHVMRDETPPIQTYSHAPAPDEVVVEDFTRAPKRTHQSDEPPLTVEYL